MSLIKANAVQIGQSNTATQNFTLAVPSSPDGTIKLARGNAGATTQDVISVSNTGVVSFPQGLGNISSGTAIAAGSTTARSLANRFADVVNVKDFGADPTGVVDSYNSFNSAIVLLESNGGGVIYVPEGSYKISQTLIIDNSNIYINGAGFNYSKLIFSSGIDGIVFNLLASGLQADWQSAYVSDISILSLNQNFVTNTLSNPFTNFGCKAISYNPTSSQQGSPYPTFKIENVYIGGQNGFVNFWNTGIYLNNVVNAVIDNVIINGYFNNYTNPADPNNLNNQATVAGVAIIDRSVQVIMSNIQMSYLFHGIYCYSSGIGTGVNKGFEGLQLVNSSIVGVAYGVRRFIGSATDSARPMTIINGCHFNSYLNSILLSDATESIITNNLFYIQNIFAGVGSPNSQPPAGAAAIVIQTQYFTTTTNRHTITGNIFRNLSSQPVTRGAIIDVENIAISNCVFDGGDFGMDYGVILQSNTKKTTISGCVFDSCSSEIQNGGDESNRYSPLTNMLAGDDVNNFNTPIASNTSIGTGALRSITTGINNTSIGYKSLFSNTSGNNNTAIGYQALQTNVSFLNCGGFGYNAQVSGSNQIRIGDTNITSVTCQTNAWSDERDKTDIRDTVLGLDFIKELRPVDYKWDYREDYRPEAPISVNKPAELKEDASDEEKTKYAEELSAYNTYKVEFDKWIEDCKWSNLVHDGTHKRIRFHHGLIAQEVKAIIEKTGVDFGGFQDHTIKGGDAVMTIGYNELIAPVIKAIQQLSNKVTALENK
jgi:hypothetical protein